MKVKYRIRGSGNRYTLYLATMNEEGQITIGDICWNSGWPKKKTRLSPGLFLVAPLSMATWKYTKVLMEGYINDPTPFLNKCPSQSLVSDFKKYLMYDSI